MTPAQLANPPVQPPQSMSTPIARIERFMAEYLDSLALPAPLDAATRYALFGPGKRARPVLVAHCCRAAGGPVSGSIEHCLPAACGVEMIHAFSLVHDDLPALDNDDLRRGRPTTHKAHGEAMAVLVGDLLNTLAFQVLAERCPDADLAGRLSLELTRGTTAMIAGQVYDTLGGYGPGLSDLQKLELVHRNKTGALIRASCRMGAICGLSAAGSPDDSASLEALSTYGESIGLMFQIVDDLLDVEQTAEHAGKATGKDAQMGKLTYPGVVGAAASRREIERLRTVALTAVTPFGDGASPLIELCEYLAVRTK